MVCGPVMYQQHVTAVRQAGLASMRAVHTGLNSTCNTGSYLWSGGVGFEELVRAVESLYMDQIQPLSRILKRRLVEQSGDRNLRTLDIDSGALRVAILAATPLLGVNHVEGGDWEAVLTDRAPDFVDPHDPHDSYPESLWQAFSQYIASIQEMEPEQYRLPASRYACAAELKERNLPFFAGLKLGSLCHIVQLSTSQKQILGYRDGALVPYSMSKCLMKKQHAELCSATTNPEEQGLPFADMASVRACIAEIMQMARWSEAGCEPLANIKRTFRARYHLELSETLLGYTKLSELLRDLPDLCYLEMRNSGCTVVPAPLDLSNLQMDSKPSECAPQSVPWKISKLEERGDIRSMVKNTFIEQPVQREGKRRRAQSVPKDFGSTKDDWETACHVLSFQYRPVNPSASLRTINVETHGCGLGLDVSDSGEALLVEDVGPGPVELWNLSHPEEVVQIGDRILQVNGVAGDASVLLSAIQASDSLELVVEPKPLNTKDDSTASTVSGQSLKHEWTLEDLTSTPCASEAGDLLCDMEPPTTTAWQNPIANPELLCDFRVPFKPAGSAIIKAPELREIPRNPQGGKIFIHSGPPPFLMA